MAEGGPSDCEIVRTRDSRIFHVRVRFSSLDGPCTTNVLPSGDRWRDFFAGCKCTLFYRSADWIPSIAVALGVHHDPVLEGAAKVSTHIVLLDKTGSPMPSMGRGMSAVTSSPRYMNGGYRLITPRDQVKANCVVDNYFVVRCCVHIDWKPPASSLEQELPGLVHDLAVMLDKQEHTDVSFNVGGESFSAHRLVLAARSPVFKAELYGPMAESKMSSITVEDMEASTFGSMLYYMYHGSLSDVAVKDVCSTMAQYQHLLIAADRYRVEGLKKICEDILSGQGITIDSVVSMLELAEDHACPKLKASCFDFLADGDNFKMVAISDEYVRLIQSSPSLFVELRSKIKKALEESTTMNPGAHKKTRLR